MKNTLKGASVATAILIAGALSVPAYASNGRGQDEVQDPSVTLCHATASAKNPYVMTTVDAAAAYSGHLGSGDVVPVFTYLGQTYGPFGDQSILGADCTVAGVEVPAEEPPVVEPPVVEPPVVEPPVVEPPVVEPPVVEPPVVEPLVVEPLVVEPPVEEPGDGGVLPDEQTPEPPEFEPADPNVTICQATASAQNPYVTITVDAAGAYNGHLGGDDIIPVFTYLGETYGPFGDQEILAAGCNVADAEPPVENEPPAEPPVEEAPVETPDEGTSPDEEVPVDEEPVDPSVEVEKPVVDDKAGVSGVERGRMDEHASRSLDRLVGRATVTTPVVAESAVAAHATSVRTLPSTGSTTGPLAVAALAAMVLGAAMIRRSARI